MSYNPYAAPQVHGPVVDASIPQGPPQPWEIGEVLRIGWETYKPHWAPLSIGFFVVSLIGGIPGQVPGILVQAGVVQQGSSEYWAVYAPFTLVGWLIGQFFAAGMIKTVMRVIRTNQGGFGDFFSGGSRYLALLGATFLTTVGVLLGFLLLVVPGVIFGLGMSLAPYYVVERKMGPVEAMMASWEATKGHKANLFLFGLVEALILIGGLCACGLGYFVAMPVVALATATIYTRLSGTAAAPAGYGVPPGGGFGGPPGGFGYGNPPPQQGGGGFGGPSPAGGGFGAPPGYGPPPGGGFGGPPGYGGPPNQ